MNIKIEHNFTEIAEAFKRFSEIALNKITKDIQSTAFAGSVEEIIHNEIDELGFSARADFLKKSFQFLTAEVTSSGLVYRIFSDSEQANKLNIGSAPSGQFTLGAKRLSNGMYSGVAPTRFMDKIAEKVNALIYEQIDKSMAESMREAGL